MNFMYEHAPLTGLIFFFSIFVWVAYRTSRPSAKKEMLAHALIPLAEEHHHE